MKALTIAFKIFTTLLALGAIASVVVLILGSIHGNSYIDEIKSWFNKDTAESTKAMIRLFIH